MKKLQIFEEDLNPGIQQIMYHVDEGKISHTEAQKIILDTFRAGMFRGAEGMGATIIEDKTNPKTLWEKLKYLFT